MVEAPQRKTTRPAHPVFNREFDIIKSLGEGNTSKVYLGRSKESAGEMVAIKILKEEFLRRDNESVLSVHNEITILKNMDHPGLVNMVGYGDSGEVVKPSGRHINNLVYIMMEYVPCGLLFDLCQTMGAMGENGGRFFISQLLDAVDYMHQKRVIHRDLKLENILVDDNLNLKIADFGFACYKNIDALKSYRGTMTYMAPEIKEGKTYIGSKVDMFSLSVILFIIVQGIFPFKEARKEEYFYGLILNNQLDTYWSKVNGHTLSASFKDLVLRLFSYEGAQRPSTDEIRSHPWMCGDQNYDKEQTRQQLKAELARRQQAKAQREAAEAGKAQQQQQAARLNASNHASRPSSR